MLECVAIRPRTVAFTAHRCRPAAPARSPADELHEPRTASRPRNHAACRRLP